ncbi:hypothetical protein JD844_022090 [Phrynosoma platyrhinos]|uniref:Protein phosphatase 1 regulatory subunit 32 n=1 Tax=Phrynosoma platyrhinos TaxID=52577 RepID=A0ABQ7SUG8_PHRPL|nr:hypothetical protein JD844_022090 [Phrynosoma platyrhinos]
MHSTVKFLTSLWGAFPFFEGGIGRILPSTRALTRTGKSYITTSPSVSSEKMGRLPLGVVSPYVKTSSGGSMDPMKFYCTSYGTAYGREGFRPRNAFHSGAGYKSNYRPVVQYKPSLDKLDNPAVKQVHFDTTDQGAQAITGLEPKHTPDLHKSQGRGSIEVENARHGPHYMSTEYGSKFRFNIPGQPEDEVGAVNSNHHLESPQAAPPSAEVSGPLSHTQFQGLQRQPQTRTNLLGREYVGNKEPTGFSLNNHPYVTPAYDPDQPNRFLTSYNSKTITTVDPFYRDSSHDRRFTALHQTTTSN